MNELDQLLLDTAELKIDASIPVNHTSFEMVSVKSELNEIQKAMRAKQEEIESVKRGEKNDDQSVSIVNHNRIMMLKPSEYAGKTGAIMDVLEKKYIVSYDNMYLRFKDIPTFKGFSKTKYLKKTNKVARKDALTGQALQFPVHPITGEIVTDTNEYNDLMNSLTEEEKEGLEYKRVYDEETNPDFLVRKKGDEYERVFYDKELDGWVIPGERSWILEGDNLETRPVYGKIEKEIPERLKVRCIKDERMINKESEFKSYKVESSLTKENFKSKYKIYNVNGELVYSNRILNVENRLDVIYKLLTSGEIENIIGEEYIDLSYKSDNSISENERKRRDVEMDRKRGLLSLEYIYGEYNGEPTMIRVENRIPMIIKESQVMKKEEVFDYYLKDDSEVEFYIVDKDRERVYSVDKDKFVLGIDVKNHKSEMLEAIKGNKLKYDPYEPKQSYNLNEMIMRGQVYVYMKAEGMYCKVESRIPKMVEIKARVTQVVTSKQIRWDVDGPKLKDGDYPLDIHMKSNENYLIRLDNTVGVLPIVSHKIIKEGRYLPSPILKKHFMYLDGEIDGKHFEVLEDRKNYIRAKVLDGELYEERSLLKTEVKFTPEFLKVNPRIYSTVSNDTKEWLEYKLGEWESDRPPSPPAYEPDSPLQPLKKKFKKREEVVKGPPRLIIKESEDSKDDDFGVDLNLEYDNIRNNEDEDEMDVDDSREMDYATEELREEDENGVGIGVEEVEQKVGYSQLSQLERFESGLNKESREVLKMIRRILRAFNYTEYDQEKVEEIIEKYLAYKRYIKEALKLKSLDRTFTEEPQLMLLLVMCYNLIVMREIITLNEYLEATVFKKYLNTTINKKFIKEVQKPTRTIVTLDKTSLKYVWVNAENTLSLERCDKEVYQETNISNLGDVKAYIDYINNIICFLKMNGYNLYVSTMSIVPDELIKLGKDRLPESKVRYELVEEKLSNKRNKRSKILQDMDYLESKKKKGKDEKREEREKTGVSIHSRVEDKDEKEDMDMDKMEKMRKSREESELIEQEERIKKRLEEFDKLLAEATRQRLTKESVVSEETVDNLKPYIKKEKSLENYARLEKNFPDVVTTKRDQVITDAILERDRKMREEFLKQMETLDAEDIAELSEQDKSDLDMAKKVKKQTQEELEMKFDNVININYGGEEYKELRDVLKDKQDDLDFIRGITEPRDDTDAAARKILVLFYKAVKENQKRYEEIQRRRVEIMDRVKRARKIRKERNRILKEFETASEMGNILGEYEEKVVEKRKRKDSDLESLFGYDSEDDNKNKDDDDDDEDEDNDEDEDEDEDEDTEMSEVSKETEKSTSIFISKPKETRKRREDASERIREKRRIEERNRREREEEKRRIVEERRRNPELMAEIERRVKSEKSDESVELEKRDNISTERKRFLQKWQPYKYRKNR